MPEQEQNEPTTEELNLDLAPDRRNFEAPAGDHGDGLDLGRIPVDLQPIFAALELEVHPTLHTLPDLDPALFAEPIRGMDPEAQAVLIETYSEMTSVYSILQEWMSLPIIIDRLGTHIFEHEGARSAIHRAVINKGRLTRPDGTVTTGTEVWDETAGRNKLRGNTFFYFVSSCEQISMELRRSLGFLIDELVTETTNPPAQQRLTEWKAQSLEVAKALRALAAGALEHDTALRPGDAERRKAKKEGTWVEDASEPDTTLTDRFKLMRDLESNLAELGSQLIKLMQDLRSVLGSLGSQEG